jgi:hypothetical protein
MKPKHFQALASVLSTFRSDIPPATYDRMIAVLCSVLIVFNPRFKATQFTEDCNR